VVVFDLITDRHATHPVSRPPKRPGNLTASHYSWAQWWAHCYFTRMNIGSIILENQIEDLMEIL
jgi:hypothetical protein